MVLVSVNKSDIFKLCVKSDSILEVTHPKYHYLLLLVIRLSEGNSYLFLRNEIDKLVGDAVLFFYAIYSPH